MNHFMNNAKEIEKVNMKKITYKVTMYYGGERPSETRETVSIEEARQWATECEHGHIENDSGISVQ